MISDRDIVYAVSRRGEAAISGGVGCHEPCHRPTVAPSDSLKGAMSLMIRQLPLIADGELVGVISMNDVAKYRLEDLETESNVLWDDIHRARGREAGLALSEGVFE
jgi:predicted transcriptional regulator